MFPLLALISGEAVISLIIYVLILGLIFGLLFFLIGYLAIPEPFNRVLRAVVMIGAVIILIGILLSLAGHPIIAW